ncbi:MAG: DUF4254 domain-containing protein [Actinomycetota bacterium]|nr:DUF4254 domain-containing protein [Actinomycetota bacterium]
MAGGERSSNPIRADTETSTVRNAIPTPLLNQLVAVGADIEILAHLQAVHAQLWLLEDRVRSRAARADEIAGDKRSIDLANAERHRLIDAFDATLDASPTHPEANRYSQTMGELCERLLILTLKIESVRSLAEDETLPLESRSLCRHQDVRLQSWKTHLERCLSEQLEAVRTGRAVLPPRSELKLYDEPMLNPVTRKEHQARENRTLRS